MESIKDKVAIIWMGTSQFGELWGKSADDLIIDADSFGDRPLVIDDGKFNSTAIQVRIRLDG